MFRFKNSYLEPTQLEKLDTHKYCSNGTSLSEVKYTIRGLCFTCLGVEFARLASSLYELCKLRQLIQSHSL